MLWSEDLRSRFVSTVGVVNATSSSWHYPHQSSGRLNASEYIYDTVPMLSPTESCVTIMCSSIPVLRPLYIHVKYGKNGQSSSSGNTSYELPIYGNGRRWGKFSKSGLESSVDERSTHHTTVMKNSAENGSNEDILRGAAGIERTDEISIFYEQFGKEA